MILYKAIKYTILDYCLTKILKYIDLNFNHRCKRITSSNEIYVGMGIRKINEGDDIYIFNSTVLSISNFGKYKCIKLKYEEAYAFGKKYEPEFGKFYFLNVDPELPIEGNLNIFH